MNVACIILAAGNSRRFGIQDKLVHELSDGVTMLESTLNRFGAHFDRITLVVRRDQHLQDLIGSLSTKAARNGLQLDGVINNKAHLGISSSIVEGIKANMNSDAWLIALADMPFVSSATINSICKAAKRERIVRPMLRGKAGNPVCIGACFRDDLLALTGDVGAQKMIQSNQDSLFSIEVNDLGVRKDIDTLEDAALELS